MCKIHTNTQSGKLLTQSSPYLCIIQCSGDPSVSTACEMVCTAVLKVLNLYVVSFSSFNNSSTVLCVCTHSHRGSNSFLDQVRNSKRLQIEGTLLWPCVPEMHKNTVFLRYFHLEFYCYYFPKGQGHRIQPLVVHS